MAVTCSSFREARPEFESASDELIKNALAEARLELHEPTWRKRYDTAVSLLAAHKLWTSPHAVTLRLEGGGEADLSRYEIQLIQLRRKTIPGHFVT